MNGQFLYDAMGGIGHDLIAEGEHMVFYKSAWRKLAEFAACLAVMIGLTMAAGYAVWGDGTYSGLPAMSQPVEENVMMVYTAKNVGLYLLAAVLALGAWASPIAARIFLKNREHRKWLTILSALLCMFAMLAQLSGLLTQAQMQQWRLLEQSAWVHLIAAAAVLLVTAVINAILWLPGAEKWNWPAIGKGTFLLLTGISAIHYIDIGHWKAIVAFFGMVETLVTLVAVVLFCRSLIKKKERAMFWINALLLVMQLCPFFGAIVIEWFHYAVFHGVCMLVGAYVLISSWNRRDEA